MAKVSSVQKNKSRERLVAKYAAKRASLLAIARDRSQPADKIFEANMELQKLPRNGHPNRVRNRCGITGRPRGNFRKFGMSRIAVRELASQGLIPGVTKSSW